MRLLVDGRLATGIGVGNRSIGVYVHFYVGTHVGTPPEVGSPKFEGDGEEKLSDVRFCI